MIAPDQAQHSVVPPHEIPSRLGRKRDLSRDPEILAAALEVLAETGYTGMTIDMVAARAKAGKATIYRRWPSKAELVIDAVACMKKNDGTADSLPDTGTLRGDLIAMIKPHSIKDGQRKFQIMAGVLAMIGQAPELAEAANAAIVQPRATANRMLMQRAKDRGEIAWAVDSMERDGASRSSGGRQSSRLGSGAGVWGLCRFLPRRKAENHGEPRRSINGSERWPNVLIVRPLLIMAGEDLPSTSSSEPPSRGLNGGPSPVMTVTGQDIELSVSDHETAQAVF